MDPDLENVIQQALEIAKIAGRDQMSQTGLAVQAVQQARPDMTAPDALAAVKPDAARMTLASPLPQCRLLGGKRTWHGGGWNFAC